LIFINIRLLVPFILNVQELADPVSRMQHKVYRLDKNLKDILKMYYSPFKLEDRNYVRFLNSETRLKNLGVHKHLIMGNLSKLLLCKGAQQVDESIVMPILICVQSYEEEATKLQKELDVRHINRSKDLMMIEVKLRQYLECLAQNILWVSHSVYDRNCNVKLPQESGAATSVSHYVWNKNLLTMSQLGTQIEVIVRNAAYNYRTIIETKNALQ
jgi:hypothetical protein